MQKKPKILLLSDWFLPGYRAGGPIRSCSNFAMKLRDQYGIYILTSDRDFKAEAPYPDIEVDKWVDFAEGVRIYYANPASSKGHLLKEQMAAIQPDFVYMNSMYSWPFTLLPLWLRWRYGWPSTWVLAPRGMLQAGAVQFKAWKKKPVLWLLKVGGFMRGIRFQATDAQEAEDVQRFFGPGAEAYLAPNLPLSDQMPWQSTPKNVGEVKLVFASRISRKKNLEFLLTHLKAVQASVELSIIGPAEDPAYLEKCKNLIAELPKHIQVKLLNPMPPQELQARLWQYHLFTLTTFGENFGHAIFEALLAGRPVLISDKTPWRGLKDLGVGWDLPLSQPEAFVAAIEKVASMDQAAFDQLSRKSWQYAADYLANPDLIKPYLNLFS